MQKATRGVRVRPHSTHATRPEKKGKDSLIIDYNKFADVEAE
jgi:hypothetical protein